MPQQTASTQPAGLGSGGSRLAGVDGVRALAALSVLVWHVWAHATLANRYGVSVSPFTKIFANMQAGVAVFFVVSGFLLFRPFARALLHDEALPSLRSYFRNRALRILPAYWAILLLVTLLFQRGLLDRPLQLLANLTFLQSYVPSYIPTWGHGFGIAPAWSLCVEVVFYLALPLLVLFARRLRGTGRVAGRGAATMPILLLAGLGIGSTALSQADGLGAVFQDSFPTHAHWFAVGMTLAVVRVRWEDQAFMVRRWMRPAAGLLAGALAAIAIKLTNDGITTFLDEQTIFAVCAGLILAIVVLPAPRSRIVAVLASRPMTALGLASYSIFLWHDPILRELRNHDLTFSGTSGFFVSAFFLLALTASASALTYLYVERPALRRKTARRSGALLGSSGALAEARVRVR
jgi:peptidoglycan/LPS O-acetylase OafA/YrhL